MNPLVEPYEIVLANESDGQAVINLLKTVANWLKNNEIKQWGFLLEGGEDEEILTAISNLQTYLVKIDNNIIGTFTLYADASEWDTYIWGDETTNALFLHRLALHPEYMKRGIGRKVLLWIENLSKEKNRDLKLDCVSSNENLNHYYKSNYFEWVGETPDGHSMFRKTLK